jgi:hypothetical protein
MLDPNIIDIMADNLSCTYDGCIGALGPAELRQAVAQKLLDTGISQPALWA